MKIITLAILSLLLISQNAFAQSQLAYVMPGSKPGTTDGGLITYANGDQFYTRALKDRSIYCHYRGAVNRDIEFSTTIGCSFGTCPTGRLVGTAEGGVDTTAGEDDAIAFITNDNDAGGIIEGVNSRYTLTLAAASALPTAIECYNTTLYGNFNTVTAANPFNFLELSNDSAININSRIVIIKNDGTELARLNVSIPAGGQKDIAIHDVAGAANTFGRITVAHDGALHGLRSSLTKYTSSFEITASKDLTTRGNEQ